MTRPYAQRERASAIQLMRTAMVEKKLTQAELADAADCHEKTIQNLLQGKPVREQTLFDVAMVLGLDYQRLKEFLVRLHVVGGDTLEPEDQVGDRHPTGVQDERLAGRLDQLVDLHRVGQHALVGGLAGHRLDQLLLVLLPVVVAVRQAVRCRE